MRTCTAATLATLGSALMLGAGSQAFAQAAL
jgi:hypothetical protein